MFRSIKVIKRPSASIPFHHEVATESSDDFKIEFFTKYVQTGKFLGIEKNISADGLTLEISINWDNRESYIEYATDESEHIEQSINESNLYILRQGFLDYTIFQEVE